MLGIHVLPSRQALSAMLAPALPVLLAAAALPGSARLASVRPAPELSPFAQVRAAFWWLRMHRCRAVAQAVEAALHKRTKVS